MKFNVIGAGRLGKNLACSLISHGHELIAVCNSRLSSANAAVEQLGQGQSVDSFANLPAVDITFITTPDDMIATIAKSLSEIKGFHTNIIVHCSGVLSSRSLRSLQTCGFKTASLHPLKAFAEGIPQNNAFYGCYCALEGEDEAVTMLSNVFSLLGAHLYQIDAENKAQYHAAAVMASNCLVTLADCAEQLFQSAGLSHAQSKHMTQSLMNSSLYNMQNTADTKDALTGPVARGDVETISMHLHALQKTPVAAFYRAAALATLPITNLTPEKVQLLSERLMNDHESTASKA